MEIDDLYSKHQSQKNYLSPITIGLIEICKSSSDFWREKSFQHIPQFIKVADNYEVIPAIILRVVIKDAYGAVEGLFIDGLRHRIKTNDWGWDSGKLSEKEALESMIWGALLSSGGFLARMAIKAYKAMKVL